MKQKFQQNRFCLPIGGLFSCSAVGVALKVPTKMIIGTKTDLLVVFTCMKLLLNSIYPMIHSSIIIVCYI